MISTMSQLSKVKGNSAQKGLAVVEFAIALPLIALLALAVTELGRGLYQFNTLSRAVHDGARYLSDVARNGIGEVDVSTFVSNTENLVIYGTITQGNSGDELLYDFVNRGSVSVTPDYILMSDGDTADNHIRVSATYTFNPLFPALANLGYSMLPSFTATAVERALVN
ncbi:MAG: TadE/TadG family type IV pilus assembly protein [bacterium]